MNKRIIVFVLLFNFLSLCDCFWGFNWLWKSSSEANRNSAVQIVGDVPVPNVPYEAKSDDEKFLEAAKQYTNLQLSDLDTCQHKIVMQIRTSCSEMTEEDLAKLSVNLLNCQSAVEGRQQFLCTSEMSLRECTSSMDPDMWNSYHLMSNRARAVCYAARQQQFRAQSDIAVNKLMQTAYAQISNMEKLKEGQQQLNSFTAQTLTTVATGQEALLQQQERMRVTQQSLKDFVSLNLHTLTREKALIAAGHKELSKLTEHIKSKLDSASATIENQTSEQQNNHRKLVQDLDNIKEQAKLIWKEIEASTDVILAQHQEASMKYEETLEKLSKINATVNFLLSLMETMRSEFNERLGWLNGVTGAAGIYAFSMHILYLLLGMIATAYVNASPFTRLCLMAIVPLNLAVLYHHGSDSALDFVAMSMIIIASSAAHWFTVHIMTYANSRTQHVPAGKMMNVKRASTEQSDVYNLAKSFWTLSKEEISKWIRKMQFWAKNELPDVHYQKSYRKQNLNDDDDNDDGDNDDGAGDNDSMNGSESSASVASHIRGKLLQSNDGHFRPLLRDTSTPLRRPFRSLENYSSPPTPPRSSSSSSTAKRQNSRASTPRPLCTSFCRTGQPCRNSALAGQDVCRIHHLDVSK